jgi:hypothetical protein
MSDENYQEIDPDAEARAQAELERHAQQEGVDRERTGDGSAATDATGHPSDIEQEIRRLAGY